MKENRGVFKTGVSAVIYTNTNRLIKGNTVRDKFLVMADSVLFFESDRNVPDGYLGIDGTNNNVDVSFIKSISPDGKFLRDDGVWATAGALPDQAGQSGKFLTTNGSVTSWGSVDPFPSQAGNSGKFLTTNGSVTSWVSVDPLPSQAGNSGKFLTTNGTVTSWSSVSASPAGADTSIQYNKSGGFEGTERFVWDYNDFYFKTDGWSLFGLDTTSNTPTAFVDIAPSVDAYASLRIRSNDGGGAPSSLHEGDIWNTGTALWIRMAGVNRRFTLM